MRRKSTRVSPFPDLNIEEKCDWNPSTERGKCLHTAKIAALCSALAIALVVFVLTELTLTLEQESRAQAQIESLLEKEAVANFDMALQREKDLAMYCSYTMALLENITLISQQDANATLDTRVMRNSTNDTTSTALPAHTTPLVTDTAIHQWTNISNDTASDMHEYQLNMTNTTENYLPINISTAAPSWDVKDYVLEICKEGDFDRMYADTDMKLASLLDLVTKQASTVAAIKQDLAYIRNYALDVPLLYLTSKYTKIAQRLHAYPVFDAFVFEATAMYIAIEYLWSINSRIHHSRSASLLCLSNTNHSLAHVVECLQMPLLTNPEHLITDLHNFFPGYICDEEHLDSVIWSLVLPLNDINFQYTDPYYIREHYDNVTTALSALEACIKKMEDHVKENLYSELNRMHNSLTVTFFLTLLTFAIITIIFYTFKTMSQWIVDFTRMINSRTKELDSEKVGDSLKVRTLVPEAGTFIPWLVVFSPGYRFFLTTGSCASESPIMRFLCVRTRDTLNLFLEWGNHLKMWLHFKQKIGQRLPYINHLYKGLHHTGIKNMC